MKKSFVGGKGIDTFIQKGADTLNTIYTKMRHMKGMEQKVIKDVLEQYESIKPYTEELLRVKKDGQWGLINKKTGKIVVEPQYDYIGKPKPTNNNGLSHVSKIKKDGLWGFMRSSGKILKEPKYAEVRDFHCNVAAVKLSQPDDPEEPWTYVGCMEYQRFVGGQHYAKVRDFRGDGESGFGRVWEKTGENYCVDCHGREEKFGEGK